MFAIRNRRRSGAPLKHQLVLRKVAVTEFVRQHDASRYSIASSEELLVSLQNILMGIYSWPVILL